ncbi:hypothetical protein [Paenibacillus shirakamiensis]|uniref:hypothetical protein n=1 Tax=Paenibacillus shirakamiensis TaxID=1265935 RepID=UPI001AEB5C90|nr:hypothetical protein [Paenibacillus shirakamiensis]
MKTEQRVSKTHEQETTSVGSTFILREAISRQFQNEQLKHLIKRPSLLEKSI